MRRTDALAVALGRNLSDLPELMGISKGMLFAYRNGSKRITGKVWSKLEAAERSAGVKREPIGPKRTSESDPTSGNRTRMIPVIGWAHAGDAENYEPVPDSWQERIPTECRDVKAFGVRLEGDSMEPKFSDGDVLIVQPSEEPYSGCYVVACFADDDGVIFRRMEFIAGEIMLKPLHEGWPVTKHQASEFRWIYPVWGMLRRMMR